MLGVSFFNLQCVTTGIGFDPNNISKKKNHNVDSFTKINRTKDSMWLHKIGWSCSLQVMVLNLLSCGIQSLIRTISEKRMKLKKCICDSILAIPHYNSIPHSQFHILQHWLRETQPFKSINVHVLNWNCSALHNICIIVSHL